MPVPYTAEFSPEWTSDYLAGLLNIQDLKEQQDVALAMKEAQAGGIGAYASMGSKIGAARAGGAQARANIARQFSYDVASKRREERLTEEQRAFQASEAQKSRDLQKQLAEMGYRWQTGEREAERGYGRVMGQQGLVAGGLLQSVLKFGGMGLGAYLGGPAGAAIGSTAGSSLAGMFDQSDYARGRDMGGYGVLKEPPPYTDFSYPGYYRSGQVPQWDMGKYPGEMSTRDEFDIGNISREGVWG